MIRTKRYASVALVAGLGLTMAACGSSKSSTPAPASTAAPGSTAGTTAGGAGGTTTGDTVTSIPSLTGVGTSVKIDSGTAAALSSLGVALAPAGTSTFDSSTSTITFPITSGYAEIHSDKSHQPGSLVGSIEHNGAAFSLTAGGKSLLLANFVVDPGNSMLYGTVGGKSAIPLLFLDGTNVAVSMAGSNVVLDGTVAKLTDAAAQAIDQTFGTTAVKAGLPLGTVHLVASGTVEPPYSDKTAEITRLSGVGTSVALNPQTAMALKSLGVSLGVDGNATFDAGTSTATFPITGGFVVIHNDMGYNKPGYINGIVIHEGSGLTLTAGAKVVKLTDFVVDPGNSILTGTVGDKSGIPLLSLDGTNVKVSMQGSNVVLDGTVAKLTDTAAAALNQAFGTTALTAGIPLGTVHLVAAGK